MVCVTVVVTFFVFGSDSESESLDEESDESEDESEDFLGASERVALDSELGAFLLAFFGEPSLSELLSELDDSDSESGRGTC